MQKHWHDRAWEEYIAWQGRDKRTMKIRFRRTSANVRLTMFEGGHVGNFAAGLDFCSRQEKGRPADFSLPDVAGEGREKQLGM